jgi:hypothetical protein
MADIEDSDPRKVIASFLSGLPQTIKPDVLGFVILYAIGVDVFPDKKDFEAVVQNYLAASGIKAIRAVICSAAVIDHHLEGATSKLDVAEEATKILIGRQPGNLTLQQARLSFPLRKRHWEQALAEWKLLRATKLSPQMLRDFESIQLSPLPPR